MLNLVDIYTPLEIFPEIYLIAGTPLLYIAPLETIVCGDLHIGELAHITNRGIAKPIFKDDTLKHTLDALIQTNGILEYNQIIFNGDIKHQTIGTNRIELDQLSKFFNHPLISSKKCILIKGNHDQFLGFNLSLLPESCEMVDHVREGKYLIHHGHELVEDNTAEVIILSHEHPAFMMTGSNFENVRVPAFVTLNSIINQFVIILPSASSLPSGVPFPPKTQAQFMSPYLKKYGDLKSVTIYPFDSTIGSFIYHYSRFPSS